MGADALPISTDRLVIRILEEGDLHGVIAYRTDPDTALLQSWTPGWSLDEARRLLGPPADAGLPEIPGGWSQLAIVDNSTFTVSGDIGVRLDTEQPDTYELGITLAPSARGSGVATEALGAVVDTLFAVGAHRVFTRSDARNERIHRVVERLGFRREAEFVDADWFKGAWTTLVVHAMLRRDWEAARLGGAAGEG
jgi:RimJ/RimL family protein N-acetyltransferase